MQLPLNFTDRKENNPESQMILKLNEKKINNQCKIVYEALLRGEKLTTIKALINYGIGDLRRRIKDLKDFHSVPIKSTLKEGGYKEYYL